LTCHPGPPVGPTGLWLQWKTRSTARSFVSAGLLIGSFFLSGRDHAGGKPEPNRGRAPGPGFFPVGAWPYFNRARLFSGALCQACGPRGAWEGWGDGVGVPHAWPRPSGGRGFPLLKPPRLANGSNSFFPPKKHVFNRGTQRGPKRARGPSPSCFGGGRSVAVTAVHLSGAFGFPWREGRGGSRRLSSGGSWALANPS